MTKVRLELTNNLGGLEYIDLGETYGGTNPVPEPDSLYFMFNVINWGNLDNIPYEEGEEFTYFVFPVAADGKLLGTSEGAEKRFIKGVQDAGKLATFSIAGGYQDKNDVKQAVEEQNGLITAIVDRVERLGYDGVTLDIENTTIDPQTMVAFVRKLREKLGPDKVIGIYTQPYQQATVWRDIGEAKDTFDWISPMIYDYGYFDIDECRATVRKWANMVGKEKTLAGLAVNYPLERGGVPIDQWQAVLQMAQEEGWKGIGIWEHNRWTTDYARSNTAR